MLGKASEEGRLNSSVERGRMERARRTAGQGGRGTKGRAGQGGRRTEGREGMNHREEQGRTAG